MEVVLGKGSGQCKEEVQFAKMQWIVGRSEKDLSSVQSEKVHGLAQRSQKWSIAWRKEIEKEKVGEWPPWER